MLNLKNYLTKKVPAVFITVAILFVTVFSMSIFANAASTFSPRLSAPSTSNQYYYSSKNIFYAYGYGMPNCTAYAFGRAYEILKTEPKLCRFNAEEWYDYNKNGGYYKYGKTAKLGAIACWSYGSGGHVAVVEKIENGTITFSNSAWGGTNFYLTTASTSASNPGQSNWTFQGYIYIGDFSASSTTATTATVNYKAGIYTVDVDDYLNMRSGAGTSYSTVISIPDGIKLTVTQVKSSGGYTWGYTTYSGKSGWVALDYCNYVSEIPTTQPTTAKPTTQPTTVKPTTQPTTVKPTVQPTTSQPVTQPTTQAFDPDYDYGVGDVNGDGKINIQDASTIQKYLIDKVEFSAMQIKNADFDFNGRVTVADVTCMQKYFVL